MVNASLHLPQGVVTRNIGIDDTGFATKLLDVICLLDKDFPGSPSFFELREKLVICTNELNSNKEQLAPPLYQFWQEFKTDSEFLAEQLLNIEKPRPFKAVGSDLKKIFVKYKRLCMTYKKFIFLLSIVMCKTYASFKIVKIQKPQAQPNLS